MTNPFAAFSELQRLKREMELLVAEANARGASALIIQFERENPNLSAFIRATFAGTPEQMLETCSAFWPGVKSLPRAREFFADVQQAVLREWEKPRGVKPKRLGG